MASFIKNMLGGSDESTEQLIAALNERLEQLEKKNNEIEKALNEQNLKIEQLLSTLEDKKLKDNNVMGSTINTSIESSYSVGNDGGDKNEASAKSEEPTTLFFSAPTPSGEFCSPSTKEQPGSSIYRLVTKDNVNGRFTMLNTPDAVATANISVSQFVKPVCKILSTTSSIPRHIITREEGTATMTDGTWKVTKKAQIEFVG